MLNISRAFYRRGVPALMRRGGGPRSGRRNALSAIERFAAALDGSGAQLFTGYRYALNEPTQTVAGLIDWYDDANLFAQPGAASLQVARPTKSALFGGHPYYTFTGAEYYDSSRAAALWKFMNFPTAAGCYAHAIYVVRATGLRTLFASYRQPDYTTQHGSMLFTNAGSNNFGYNVGRANTTRTVAVNSTLAGTAVVRAVSVEYAETGVNPEWRTRNNGTVISSGLSAAAPVDANPSATMRVGGMAVTLESLFVGDLAQLFFMPSTPTADQRAAIQEMFATYGVA